MRNKIKDLNNHLFAQLEKISDEDLTAEQIEKEVVRSKSIVDLSNAIVSNAKITLEAAKMLEKDHPSTASAIASIFINDKIAIENE